MKRFATLVLIGAASLVVRTAPAAPLTDRQREDVLSEAMAAYDEGIRLRSAQPQVAREQFAESAERFELLVLDGVVNGPLLYNLGNAHLQAGELGRAILSYRRAERLSPGDPRLRANLDAARSLRRTQLRPSGERALSEALLGWHTRTSMSLRIGLFAIGYGVFWAALLARRFSLSPVWTWTPILAVVLWVPAGASAGADLLDLGERREGVLIAEDVIVRKGNGSGYAPKFQEPLHEGVEFEILEERPGWWLVRFVDGSEGWVDAASAAMI